MLHLWFYSSYAFWQLSSTVALLPSPSWAGRPHWSLIRIYQELWSYLLFCSHFCSFSCDSWRPSSYLWPLFGGHRGWRFLANNSLDHRIVGHRGRARLGSLYCSHIDYLIPEYDHSWRLPIVLRCFDLQKTQLDPKVWGLSYGTRRPGTHKDVTHSRSIPYFSYYSNLYRGLFLAAASWFFACGLIVVFSWRNFKYSYAVLYFSLSSMAFRAWMSLAWCPPELVALNWLACQRPRLASLRSLAPCSVFPSGTLDSTSCVEGISQSTSAFVLWPMHLWWVCTRRLAF